MVTFSRNGTSFWLCKQILSKTVVPPELWRYLGENHHNTPRPKFCFLSLGFPCTFMAAEWWPMCSKSIMQFELNWIVCIGFFWHYVMHQAFVHLKFPKFALKNTNTTYQDPNSISLQWDFQAALMAIEWWHMWMFVSQLCNLN